MFLAHVAIGDYYGTTENFVLPNEISTFEDAERYLLKDRYANYGSKNRNNLLKSIDAITVYEFSESRELDIESCVKAINDEELAKKKEVEEKAERELFEKLKKKFEG